MKERIRITSPYWDATTKLLVGIVLVALIGLLMIKLQNLIAPLLLVVILIYTFRPLVTRVYRVLQIPWSVSVGLVYLVLVGLFVFLVAELGAALVSQATNLAELAQQIVEGPSDVLVDLPLIDILPITFDVQGLLQQGATIIQPMLGSLGGVLGSVAGAAATSMGWLLFILVVSYFLLLDLDPEDGWSVTRWTPEPYRRDVDQLGHRISGIWQRFLFGQGLLFVLTAAVVTVFLSILGLSNALVLGLLSGLARFVPYVGPTVVWFLMFIVALVQPDAPFGLSPLWYATLVVALQVVIDQIFDNVVAPRLFGQVLGVHPAAVLITAIALVFIIGPLGLLVAAPVLASTLQLGQYTMAKLFDLQEMPHSPDAVTVDPPPAKLGPAAAGEPPRDVEPEGRKAASAEGT